MLDQFSGAVTARGRPGSGVSRRSGGQGDRSTVTSTGAVLYSLYMSQSISVGYVKVFMVAGLTQWQELAQELKEMTALATYHMTQMLADDRATLTQKQRGRLQKGKLKPLYPVHTAGPSIRQCRGILSETRSYSASASRTLQRRRQLVSQLKSGALKLGRDNNNKPSSSPPPRYDGSESESVHRVSAASSVEDLVAAGEGGDGEEKGSPNDEDFQAELASMERDAAALLSEIEAKESSNTDDTEESKEKYKFKDANKTSLAPEQDTSSQQKPDISAPHTTQSSQSRPDFQKTDRGRKDSANLHSTTSSAKALNGAASSKNGTPKEAEPEKKPLHLHTKKGNLLTTDGDDHSEENGSPYAAPAQTRRPVSAIVDSSFSPLTSVQIKTRPQTAASAKTVRFANLAHSSDGRRLPVSQSNSWMGKGRGKKPDDKGQNKARKKSAGESCKPHDLDKNGREDEDEDEGEGKKSNGGGSCEKGRNGSGLNRAAPQGSGDRRQTSDSRHSPQDGEDIPCFVGLTPLLQNRPCQCVEEPKPGNCGDVQGNRRSASQRRKGENRTVHGDSIFGVEEDSLLYLNEAEESLFFQCLSDPQKIPVYQNDENDPNPGKNSSTLKNTLEDQFTFCGERTGLQKHGSALGSEQHARSRGQECAFDTCTCGKDIVGLGCKLSADHEHRSALMGKFPSELKKRVGLRGTQHSEGHISSLWTWLDGHFRHSFSSLLIL
ncbi:hypothetical protein ACOMHN_000771 [Nucella lapillus]